MIKNIFANWKTTTAGITVLVLSVYNIVTSWRVLDGNGWATSVIGIATGLALIFAADTNTPPPTTPKPND